MQYNKKLLGDLVRYTERLIQSIQDSMRVLNNPEDFKHDDVIAEFTFIERIRLSLISTERLMSLGMIWGHDRAHKDFEHNSEKSETDFWQTNQLMHYVFDQTPAEALMREKKDAARKEHIKAFFADSKEHDVLTECNKND